MKQFKNVKRCVEKELERRGIDLILQEVTIYKNNIECVGLRIIKDDELHPIVYFDESEMGETFIRLYYHNDMKSFYYIAMVGGKEKRREYRCDLWNMEQVIEHFKKDIEKSKKWKEQQKIDKIKEDF